MVALLWVLVGVLLILAVLGPKRTYWKLQAWKYKNPEANEPSDTSYGVATVMNWVLFVIVVIIAIAVTASVSHKLSASEVYSVASSAASEIDGNPKAGDVLYSVENVVENQSNGAKVHVHDAGDDGDGTSRYEITNTDDKNPSCLSVTVDYEGLDFDHPDVSADAEEGAC